MKDLFLLSDAQGRSISPENPDGAKGGGAKGVPDSPQHPSIALGLGWKVRPCIALPAGETVTLADVAGPGIIQHIWIMVAGTTYCLLED